MLLTSFFTVFLFPRLLLINAEDPPPDWIMPYTLLHHKLNPADATCSLNNEFMECLKKCTHTSTIITEWNKIDDALTVDNNASLVQMVAKGYRSFQKNKLLVDAQGSNPTKIVTPASLKELTFSCLMRCHVRPRKEICRSDCKARMEDAFFIDDCIANHTSLKSEQKTAEAIDEDIEWKNSQDTKDCFNFHISTSRVCHKEFREKMGGVDKPGRDVLCSTEFEECVTHTEVHTGLDLKECFANRLMEIDVAYFTNKAKDHNDFGIGPCDAPDPLVPPTNPDPEEQFACDRFLRRSLSPQVCLTLCEEEFPKDEEEEKHPLIKCQKECDGTLTNIGIPTDEEIHEKGEIPEASLFYAKAVCLLKCYTTAQMAKSDPCDYDRETIVALQHFSDCTWKVDFSLTTSPEIVSMSYFNEKTSYDQKDKLLRPNSLQFLKEVNNRELNNTKGYYVFPYFLVIRGQCEIGGFYDEGVYKLFIHGNVPAVSIQYWPNPREENQAIFKGIFKSALVRLSRLDNSIIVPRNPAVHNKTKEDECYWGICYPGFLVPLIAYKKTTFDVEVEAQDVFSSLNKRVYVAAYASRDEEGIVGTLILSNYTSDSRFITVPSAFFPQDRVGPSEDEGVRAHVEGELDPVTHAAEEDRQEMWYPYKFSENKDTQFSPLDGEDFGSPQFLYGLSPVVVFSGFYDPGLVLMGDPDMDDFELVEWTLNRPHKDLPIFSRFLNEGNHAEGMEEFRCFDYGTSVSRGHRKLLYSRVDESDPYFPINYYRVRYAPKDYSKGLATHAIFDIISLDDRLLLVTARGLVVFFGNTFDVKSGQERLFHAPGWQQRDECFKFVRVAARASSSSEDLIVGVTYEYGRAQGEKVDQRIVVGIHKGAGEDIDWKEVTSATETDDDLYSEDVESQEGDGVEGDVDDTQKGLVPVKQLMQTATSEVQRVCYQAYIKAMLVTEKIIIRNSEPGWCEALDATPLVNEDLTFLMLIRMKLLYVGDTQAFKNGKANFANYLYFYILASTSVTPKSENNSSTSHHIPDWTIRSIIPRIPCVFEHLESIRALQNFDSSYFTKEGIEAIDIKNWDKNQKPKLLVGCHSLLAYNPKDPDFRIPPPLPGPPQPPEPPKEGTKHLQDWIFLNRIVTSRMQSNHIFLFGTVLLESNDGGRTFVTLGGFSDHDTKTRKRIEMVATNERGSFAFLTNDRALYVGSTGHKTFHRLRPTPGNSVTQTIVSSARGLQDAVPFNIMYDSGGSLFEMVAVLDPHHKIKRIMKRPVPTGTIMRHQDAIVVTENNYKRELARLDNLKPPPDPVFVQFTYDPSTGLYCPYNSPIISDNYTGEYARNQIFEFSPPLQHADFGKAYETPALWAYQVATYSLVFNSIYQLDYDSYAATEHNPDEFNRWPEEKDDVSRIGHVQFLMGDKDSHGILVDPRKYRRNINRNSAGIRLFKHYYLDYSTVVELHFTFSIKSDTQLGNTNYNLQKISLIQINVDNPNGTLLQIDTEQEPLAAKASMKFIVRISVKRDEESLRKLNLAQHPPGQHLIKHHLIFHLIGGFGKCVPRVSDPLESDSYATSLSVGCRPSNDLLFNWNKTLYSIHFRDKKAHYGLGNESGCYGGEFVCFYARSPMILHFDIFDVPKQAYIPYNGSFVMRVIAGGNSRDDMTAYTPDEQEAYNIPGVSDVSLIWDEWDKVTKQRKGRKGSTVQGTTTRETVLRAGVSFIQWTCHTLSPCARVSLNWALEPVYFIRIAISNRGVDNETLCLYEKTFDLMLYGFPSSPELQLFTTLLFCLTILLILYLLYICTRNNRKVWKASKARLRKWWQILKDTTPKALKTHEEEAPTVDRTQHDKDKILLSLQGHLRVPSLVSKTGPSGEKERRAREMSVASSMQSYDTAGTGSGSTKGSVASGSTTGRSQRGEKSKKDKDGVKSPTTWTDLVYEQIIAKRLAAIINRNKKLRANILQKAGNRNVTEEHEKSYEAGHKQTVDEESVFTGQSPQTPPPRK